MGETLIVCVGNSLVGDDAVGFAIFERLRDSRLPPGVRLHFLELGGIGLLDLVRGEPLLLIVDAVRFQRPPGTIHVVRVADLPAAGGPPVTSHDIGIREALDIGAILYPERMPAEILLVGIEGECFDQLGVPLSPAVLAAVDDAVSTIIALARGEKR